MSRCHFILVFIPVWTSKAYYSTSSSHWTDLWKIVSQEKIFPKILSAEYKQDTIKHCAQCATIYGFKCGCAHTQSRPTLCDTMDCSPPGSSAHGDAPGRDTRVGCHFLLQRTFRTQGLNLSPLCLLHREVGSLPLAPHVE